MQMKIHILVECFFNSNEFIRIFSPRCLICRGKQSLYGCAESWEAGLPRETSPMRQGLDTGAGLSQAGWKRRPRLGDLNPRLGLGPLVCELVIPVFSYKVVEKLQTHTPISVVFTILQSPGPSCPQIDHVA